MTSLITKTTGVSTADVDLELRPPLNLCQEREGDSPSAFTDFFDWEATLFAARTESDLSAAYAEFEAEDRELAGAGLADFFDSLRDEDAMR